MDDDKSETLDEIVELLHEIRDLLVDAEVRKINEAASVILGASDGCRAAFAKQLAVMEERTDATQ